LPREPQVLLALANAHLADGDLKRAHERCTEALATLARSGAGGKLEEDSRSLLDRIEREKDGQEPISKLVAGRRALSKRMASRPLSSCVDDLIALSALHEEHGDSSTAKAIALFAAELAPSSTKARARVIAAFEDEAELFVRVWARRGVPADEARLENARELESLGLPSVDVMASLPALRSSSPTPDMAAPLAVEGSPTPHRP